MTGTSTSIRICPVHIVDRRDRDLRGVAGLRGLLNFPSLVRVFDPCPARGSWRLVNSCLIFRDIDGHPEVQTIVKGSIQDRQGEGLGIVGYQPGRDGKGIPRTIEPVTTDRFEPRYPRFTTTWFVNPVDRIVCIYGVIEIPGVAIEA